MKTRPPTTAIVLAAGQGTRMRSDKHKLLHELAGRPVIAHVVDTVSRAGAGRIVVVLGHGMEDVARAAAPARIAIQDRPLGTAHAALAAREAVGETKEDVLVLYGDTPLLTPETIARMLEALNGPDDPAVVVLGARPPDPAGYGRLILDRRGGLERIVEERDATEEERAVPLCYMAGMAVKGAHLFDLLAAAKADNAQGEHYLTDIVEIARARGLGAAVSEGPYEDALGINSRAQLADAERVIQARYRAAHMAEGVTLQDPETVYFSHDTEIGRDTVIGPNVVFGPGVRVGRNVTIKAFSHLEGARVGDGAEIGPFARLRPEADIGPRVHIGNFVEIKKAVVEAEAKINHLTYIGDARVGARTNIGAGTITCNYDGLTKWFTDIGADVFVGSNAAFVAPITIADEAYIGAGSVVTKHVPSDALAVTRAEQRNIEGGASRARERARARKAEHDSALEAERVREADKQRKA